MLHDATGLEVKPSPSKATNKAENILAAEHVVSTFRELRNEWGYCAILWLPEIRRLSPEAPIILVGTHIDLETNLAVILQLSNTNQEMVTMERALGLVKKAGIVCYIETSAVTQKNMKSVFDKAIMSVLRPPTSRSHPNVAPKCCACM